MPAAASIMGRKRPPPASTFDFTLSDVPEQGPLGCPAALSPFPRPRVPVSSDIFRSAGIMGDLRSFFFRTAVMFWALLGLSAAAPAQGTEKIEVLESEVAALRPDPRYPHDPFIFVLTY